MVLSQFIRPLWYKTALTADDTEVSVCSGDTSNRSAKVRVVYLRSCVLRDASSLPDPNNSNETAFIMMIDQIRELGCALSVVAKMM